MRKLMRLFVVFFLAATITGIVVFPVVAQAPIGTIEMYAGDSLPSGRLWADGTCYSTTTYPELYAAIGYYHTPYTDIMAGNYCVPDMELKFPVGVSEVGCISAFGDGAPGFYNCLDLGNWGGEITHTLTITEMPSHNHELYRRIQWIPDGAFRADYGQEGSGASGHHTLYTGGGEGHNNIPPFLALNFVIVYTTTNPPTPTPGPTPTPTATPTPPVDVYTHTLSSSGKTLTVPVSASFGQLFVAGSFLLLTGVVGLRLVVKLVYRL